MTSTQPQEPSAWIGLKEFTDHRAIFRAAGAPEDIADDVSTVLIDNTSGRSSVAAVAVVEA